MADTIDSLSIELTADTSAAEGSIDRLILKLERLKSAVSGASNFSKVAQGIARIAAVASGIDNDAGKKLAKLAAGVTALSKVGDLSNLKDAGKNLASVVKAVNGLGAGGAGGLGSMASAIRDTRDALGGIRESDVSKLGAIQDALSGETSGPLHTSGRMSESATLGGMGTPEPNFGNMAVYGAMTVFKYTADSIRDASNAYQEFRKSLGAGVPPVFSEFTDEAHRAGEAMRELGGSVPTPYGAMTVFAYVADSIRDATAAYKEFRTALGAGVPPVFTEFVDGAKEAKRAVLELGSAIRGLLTEGQNFSTGTSSDTFWGMKRTPLLNAGQDFTFGGANGLDKSNAIEIEDLGERIAEANEVANAYSNLHDRFVALQEEMLKTNSFLNGARDAASGKLPGVALSLSDFKGFAGLNAATNSLKEFLNTSVKLPTVTVSLKDFAKTLGGMTGAGVKAALYDLPKFFGGKLLDSIRQATKGMTGLFNSFVRIAKYRAIRTALRLITQGIGDGIKNLYAWSAATNGEFKASMDMIATASQYLGNSFAAMVSPLIQRLAPAIDFIVDKFVDMFNVVNQIFARLTGQTSYTAAKKIKSQWQDASKSASGAAKKAAKEIRATLLGFDEINRLNAATDSTGGSVGGAGSGISAEDMFEQRPISSWIQEMVDGSDFTKLGSTVAQKINEALGGIDWTSIKKGAKGVAESVVSAINGFIGEIDPRTVGHSIAEIVNTGMTLIDTFWSETDWAQAGQKLRTALVTFFEDVDVELAADALMGKFRSLVTLIYNAIPKEESEWETIGTKISTFINRSIENIDWATIGDSIGLLLMGAIKTMTLLADDMTLTHIADGIKTAIESACENITAADVARWVGAVLKDVLSAVGVLFSIQLDIDGMKISPLALLTFSVLAKTLIGKMIGNVFGATAGMGLGAGLAWTASIGLAVSAGVQILGVWDDVKNGKPIDPQKVADIVQTAFAAIGFGILAKGNPLGAAFMIGLGFAVKPLVKGILEVFFPADGEVKATKNGVIDILKGAFRTAGVGLVYAGVKSGNLAMAGAGAAVFGFSFMIEPIVNDFLDFKSEMKSGSVSIESICKVLGDVLIGIGTAVLLFVNPVAGAVVIGIGALLKLVISDAWIEWDKEASARLFDKDDPTSIYNTDPLMGGVQIPASLAVDPTTVADQINNITKDPVEIPANVKTDTVNGKNWFGQVGEALGELFFPGAKAEMPVDFKASIYNQAWMEANYGPYKDAIEKNPMVANVKTNGYDQSWANNNIKSYADGLKANPLEMPVKLVKSATSTVASLLSSLFGKKDEKEQKVDVKTNLVKGDLSLLDSIEEKPLTVKVQLQKYLWTTLERFVDLKPVYNVPIKLTKQGWSTIQAFVDIVKPHIVEIKLQKNGWSTIQAFVGTAVDVTVRLLRASKWSSGLADWIGREVTVTVDLVRHRNWSSGLEDWVGTNKTVSVGVKLYTDGWRSVWEWVTGGKRPVVIVDVKLNNASGYRSVGDFVRGNKSNAYSNGGVSPNGASAAMDASAMYSAAMSAANAATGAPASVDFGGGYEAAQSDSEAGWPVMPNNDREVALMQTMLEVLRNIEAKDTTVEVTAQSVTRAQQRMNRRAGVTIVPIGT